MKNLKGKIYDKMLLAYAHFDIILNEFLDYLEDRKKVNRGRD